MIALGSDKNENKYWKQICFHPLTPPPPWGRRGSQKYWWKKIHDLSALCQPLFFWIYCNNIYLSRSFAIPALSRTEYLNKAVANVHRITFTFSKHLQSWCCKLFEKVLNLGKSLAASTLTCPLHPASILGHQSLQSGIKFWMSNSNSWGKTSQAPPWLRAWSCGAWAPSCELQWRLMGELVWEEDHLGLHVVVGKQQLDERPTWWESWFEKKIILHSML